MIVIRRRCGRWEWCCHFCHPPASGSRNQWADVFRISLPRHFRVREFHHAHVAKMPVGKPLPPGAIMTADGVTEADYVAWLRRVQLRQSRTLKA